MKMEIIDTNIYEITYYYNYNGKKDYRYENATASRLEYIKKQVAKAKTNDLDSYYSDLKILRDLGPKDTSNLQKWLKIGLRNRWIREAYDPPFTIKSFHECKTIKYLIDRLKRGNYCLGQAFYYKNMCFINQIDGGDEWLVIRDEIPFESWSCRHVIEYCGEEKFKNILARMMNATDDQLKNLDYMKAEPAVLVD